MIQIEGNSIIPCCGFPYNDPIIIVSEELCYNDDYEDFKVLFIDRFIGTQAKRKSGTVPSSPNKFTKDLSWYKEFLLTEPSYHHKLILVKEEIDRFNTTYVLMEEYLDRCVAKIRHLYEKFVDEFAQVKPIRSEIEADDLTVAIESFLMSGIHLLIFEFFDAKYSSKYREFSSQMLSFNERPFKEFGVNDSFDCNLNSAVKALKKMNSCLTPHDALTTMKKTVDCIFTDVATHVREISGPFTRSLPTVSGDDLIPLVARVISRARLSKLERYLQFAQTFHFAVTLDDGELSYACVTFKAASQLIQESSGGKLNPAQAAAAAAGPRRTHSEYALDESIVVSPDGKRPSKALIRRVSTTPALHRSHTIESYHSLRKVSANNTFIARNRSPDMSHTHSAQEQQPAQKQPPPAHKPSPAPRLMPDVIEISRETNISTQSEGSGGSDGFDIDDPFAFSSFAISGKK